MNDVTFNFIKEHLNDDVKCLALSAFPEDVDKNFVINQIYARQLLRHSSPHGLLMTIFCFRLIFLWNNVPLS